jgi:predicted enzyme related to lactoylglutathione lyase
MPNRVSHFEIQADDITRATKFYTEVFGWKITKWEGGQMVYSMVETGPRDEAGGINGGIIQRPCPAPAPEQGMNGYCATITVENYDEIAKKILEHGGKEAMPKFALIGMAWQGYFLDTEGNTFGLHQPDVNAK